MQRRRLRLVYSSDEDDEHHHQPPPAPPLDQQIDDLQVEMLHSGGDDAGSWRSAAEDDDDLEILDDNEQRVNAIANKASPGKIHDWYGKGKRKFAVKSKVPAKKLCLPNMKLSSCPVQKYCDWVETLSSNLTNDKVKSFFLRANISSADYEFLIPSKDQRANKPPEGYMTVYKKQIEQGLRFPLHGLVIEVCNAINVSPSQLTPTAHSTIVAFLLCVKFYRIPATAKLFFSMFSVQSTRTAGFFFFLQRKGFYFLKNTEPPYKAAEWKKQFFFLKPTRMLWNCITKWNETYSRPAVDASLAESAVNLGMTKHRFQVNSLIRRTYLVHGGIEPGSPASELTFRSLMARAAMTTSKLLPEAKYIARATTQGLKIHSKGSRSEPAQSSNINPATIANTLNATGPASNLVLSTRHTASPVSLSAAPAVNHEKSQSNPSSTDVPILNGFQASSKDSIPLHEPFQVKDNLTAKSFEPYVTTSSSMTVADDCARTHALPPPLLAMSQMLESMYVQKECYQKLQMEMKELTSELTYTKSQVEELEQKLELSEAKRVDSENRTSCAMEEVKRLKNTIKDLRSDSARCHEKIKNEASRFKSSQELLDNIEKVSKDTVDTFKSSQDLLGSLDQIKRDAIKKFKLSEEFLDWNDKIRTHAIKAFKHSDEFLESCERIRKVAIERYKSSDEFLESLNQIRTVAVESFKSSNEFLDFRDNTRKEAIEVFRCSDEFWRETVKYYLNGFEACRLQFMNCGELPKGFKLDFLDVAGPLGKLRGQVHDGAIAAVSMKSIKPER